jgi:hypothetical protein
MMACVLGWGVVWIGNRWFSLLLTYLASFPGLIGQGDNGIFDQNQKAEYPTA